MIYNEEPYFVGKDVAKALGYKDTRSTVSRKIDSEDKGVVKLTTPSGMQETTIINESGLYSLILGSQLESAKRFKRWVTKDVLPSIRKNGGYIIGQEKMTDDEILARGLMVANNIIKDQKHIIGNLKDESLEKSSFIDLMSGLKDKYMISEIAYYYDMSAIALNRKLADLNIQTKEDGMWKLTSQYANNGYVETIYKNDYLDGVIIGRKYFNAWTKAGVKFIYYTLKDIGILPTMEKEARENEIQVLD